MLRPSSAAADESRLRIHLLPVFGESALKDITPLTVRSFVACLAARRAPKTVRNVFALLSTILRDAVLEGLLLSNPCIGVRLPADTAKEARFLSPVELEALLAVAPAEHRTLLLVAAGTGLRWGELAAMPVASLDLLRRRMQVTRTLSDVNGALSFGPPKTAVLAPVGQPAPDARRGAQPAPARPPRRAAVHRRRRRAAAPQQLLLPRLETDRDRRRSDRAGSRASTTCGTPTWHCSSRRACR